MISQRVYHCNICFFLISVGASFKPIHDEATNSTSSVTQTTTATEASTVIASHPDPDQPTGNTTANSATVSGSGLTENSSSNQQPQNSGSSVPDSSGANHTENTPPVKPTATSAASKAAAFFTSGKMSSSSTEKIKSKSSLVEGSDCEYTFFCSLRSFGANSGIPECPNSFCDHYCSMTHSTWVFFRTEI